MWAALDGVQKQRQLIVRQTLEEGVRSRFDPTRANVVVAAAAVLPSVWRRRVLGGRGRRRQQQHVLSWLSSGVGIPERVADGSTAPQLLEQGVAPRAEHEHEEGRTTEFFLRRKRR